MMMKKISTIILLIILSAALAQVSSSEVTVTAKNPPDTPAGFSLEDMADKYFCNVSGAGVCIITQTNEDCAKLGGELVMNCNNAPFLAEDEHHGDGSCMPKEESLEPVYCYGF